MCLSTAALVLFLNTIGADLTETVPNRITITATGGPVTWVRQGPGWCTDAPQEDQRVRFRRGVTG